MGDETMTESFLRQRGSASWHAPGAANSEDASAVRAGISMIGCFRLDVGQFSARVPLSL